MIRTDGTIPRYAPTPLAMLQGGSADSGFVEDPVIQTVFRVMAQINRLWSQVYRYQWEVYVCQVRVVQIAADENCGKDYVHRLLKRGEEYLAAGLGATVAEDAVIELEKYYKEKIANRPFLKQKIAIVSLNRPLLRMPAGKKV